MRFPCLLLSRQRTDRPRNQALALPVTSVCTKRHNGVRLRLCILACLAATNASAAGRCLCLSTLPCFKHPCRRSSSSILARASRNLTVPTSLRLSHSSPAAWDPTFESIRRLVSDWICDSIPCQRLRLPLHRTILARTTSRRLLTARQCQLLATIRHTAARSCRQWLTRQA